MISAYRQSNTNTRQTKQIHYTHLKKTQVDNAVQKAKSRITNTSTKDQNKSNFMVSILEHVYSLNSCDLMSNKTGLAELVQQFMCL